MFLVQSLGDDDLNRLKVAVIASENTRLNRCGYGFLYQLLVAGLIIILGSRLTLDRAGISIETAPLFDS